MNTCARLAVLSALLFLLHPAAATAFGVNKTDGGLEIKWASPGETFYINTAGGPAGSAAAITAAAATWTAVAGSDFTFTYAGTTNSTAFDQYDGQHNVGFGPLVGAEYAGTLALNTFYYDPTTGHLLDSDIQFNTNFPWNISPNGTPGYYDVQNVCTHEMGHSLSLEDLYDTSDSEKTMYGYAAPGETKKRTLDPDDIAGITYLYPAVYANVLGDCNGDWHVTIAEVQSAINMYLGISPVLPCADRNGDGKVMIDEVQTVINWYRTIP